MLSGITCLFAVDFITGVVHWAEDTWTALGRSKLLDTYVVRDNIEHHRKPGAIRRGTYWESNRVCIVLALGAACVLVLFGVHAWQAYVIVALASQSNQVHKWAHCANPPLAVAWLQRFGILQSTPHHAEHHKRPYAKRYSTTTNFLNPVLDAVRFWRGLEWLIERCGVKVQRTTPAREGY
ncbi:MAG TPA: fatty acid desaturase CarF family protein [Candidatus Elarobacter sp.]